MDVLWDQLAKRQASPLLAPDFHLTLQGEVQNTRWYEPHGLPVYFQNAFINFLTDNKTDVTLPKMAEFPLEKFKLRYCGFSVQGPRSLITKGQVLSFALAGNLNVYNTGKETLIPADYIYILNPIWVALLGRENDYCNDDFKKRLPGLVVKDAAKLFADLRDLWASVDIAPGDMAAFAGATDVGKRRFIIKKMGLEAYFKNTAFVPSYVNILGIAEGPFHVKTKCRGGELVSIAVR